VATSVNTPNTFGFKNRIINGDMRIDQRNAGAVVSAEAYLVDRWRVYRNQTYNIQQSTDAPTGFKNSLLVTKTNTTQSTYGYLVQFIEGFNFADMEFGTANAATVTLSFWVKSSVTGTFTAGIGNAAGSFSSSTSFYPATYTISAANTWEQKTITIAGQTSGTWLTTNAAGASVYFNFGATGSATANSWNSGDLQVASTGGANLGTTNNATFRITGVQLEKGSTATSFDVRDYGRELILCQRYYERINDIIATCTSGGFNNSYANYLKFTVTKRDTPTVTIYSAANLTGTAGSATWYSLGAPTVATASIVLTSIDTVMFMRAGNNGFSLVGLSAAIVSEL
jgi:hypothetical protein